MFNNFYENLPPVDLGKQKLLGFGAILATLLISWIGAFAGKIGYYIEIQYYSVNITFFIVQVLLYLFLSYSVVKTFYISTMALMKGWTSKSYQISYGDIQAIKRRSFSLSFLSIILIWGFIGVSYTYVSQIIHIAFSAAFIFSIALLSVSLNQILRPFKQLVQEELIKQQQAFQSGAAGAAAHRNGAGGFASRAAGWGQTRPTNSPPTQDSVRKDLDDEEFATASGVKVVDITDDLKEKDKEKIDKRNDEDDDSGTPPDSISAF